LFKNVFALEGMANRRLYTIGSISFTVEYSHTDSNTGAIVVLKWDGLRWIVCISSKRDSKSLNLGRKSFATLSK
jgi:hypothetical protein